MPKIVLINDRFFKTQAKYLAFNWREKFGEKNEKLHLCHQRYLTKIQQWSRNDLFSSISGYSIFQQVFAVPFISGRIQSRFKKLHYVQAGILILTTCLSSCEVNNQLKNNPIFQPKRSSEQLRFSFQRTNHGQSLYGSAIVERFCSSKTKWRRSTSNTLEKCCCLQGRKRHLLKCWLTADSTSKKTQFFSKPKKKYWTFQTFFTNSRRQTSGPGSSSFASPSNRNNFSTFHSNRYLRKPILHLEHTVSHILYHTQLDTCSPHQCKI